MENLRLVSERWVGVTRWEVELLAPLYVIWDTQIQIFSLLNSVQDFEPTVLPPGSRI